MLFNFARHYLFDRNAALKTSIYLLVIIGLVWLSIANYYYYSNQWDNFCGAATSSLLFLGTALLVRIYLYYYCKKHSVTERLSSLSNNLSPAMTFAGQPILKLIYNKGRDLAKENKLASFMLLGTVGLATAYMFFHLMHNKDKCGKTSALFNWR